ncbi:hypothetical protein Tco_1556724 [Tanacetum coccineum]
MASFDYRLNPLYAIKECSSCGTLYTGDCGCSKGGLEDKILVPIPDLSRRPLKIEKICLDCGDPVHGLYCRQCALIRKTLEEVFQDFQDTSKSSDDDTNFVNQEPFVVKQGPECGDSLDGIFCQRCTCKSCGKGAHIGYNCPPQIPIISNPEPCYNQNLNEILQNLQSLNKHVLFGSCQQLCLFNAQNEFLNLKKQAYGANESMCDMVGPFSTKKREKKCELKKWQSVKIGLEDSVWLDDDVTRKDLIPLKSILFLDFLSVLQSHRVINREKPLDSLIRRNVHSRHNSGKRSADELS